MKHLKRMMIKFFNFLIYSNVFISICAAGLYFIFSLKSELNFPITNILFIFSSTYIGYHLLRIVPLMRKHFIEEGFKEYYQQYKLYNWISLIIMVIINLCCFIQLDLQVYPVLLLNILLVLLYETILFKNFALRKVPYAKSFIIALVWSLTMTQLNGYHSPALFLDCFSFILLLSIPFDIKDLNSDTNQEIKTLPMLFKDKLYLGLSLFYVAYAIIHFQITNELFFLTSVPLYIGLIYFAKKDKLNKSIYYLGFDGLIILRVLFYLS